MTFIEATVTLKVIWLVNLLTNALYQDMLLYGSFKIQGYDG